MSILSTLWPAKAPAWRTPGAQEIAQRYQASKDRPLAVFVSCICSVGFLLLIGFSERITDVFIEREVKRALFRGLDTWGFDNTDARRILGSREQCRAFLRGDDALLRRELLRWSGKLLYLDVVCEHIETGPVEDRQVGFEAWVESLVVRSSEQGMFVLERRLEATSQLRQQPSRGNLGGKPEFAIKTVTINASARYALLATVLGEAARRNTRLFDAVPEVAWQVALQERNQGGGPNAARFQEQLDQVKAVLWSIATLHQWMTVNDLLQPQKRITEWEHTGTLLTEEKPEPTPKRTLGTIFLLQLQEPLAWFRKHADHYRSPFLSAGFWFDFAPDPNTQNLRSIRGFLTSRRLSTDEDVEKWQNEFKIPMP